MDTIVFKKRVFRIFLFCFAVSLGQSDVMNGQSNSQTVVYADKFPGDDAAAKISAAIASLSSDGGIVDATNFKGIQYTHANPLAGVNKPLLLLLGPSTFLADAPWVLPPAVIVRGMGRLYIGNKGSVIKASSKFPKNTAVIQIGLSANGFTQGTRIENLNIDGSAIEGVSGVLSENSGEQSGVFFVDIGHCGKYGIHFTGANSQFFSIENVEIYPQDAGTPETVGIYIDGLALPATVQNVTVVATKERPALAAVQLDRTYGGVYESIHGEYVSHVLQIGVTGPVNGIVAMNISGSNNGVTDVVLVSPIQGTSGFQLGGLNSFGSKCTINDMRNGVSNKNPSVGTYSDEKK